jgi:endonuclease/exonuclease/phosphatase family metal-dependent hydrolase
LGYENVVLFEGNDARGIDVAVLSRLPVGPVTSYRHVTYHDPDGRPAHFRRDLLRVRIEPPAAQNFDMFVMHLKSKRDGPAAEAMRLGEAAAARAILDQVLRDDPEACFVLCGDMNDTFDSEPVRTLVGSGPASLPCFFSDIPEEQQITFNQEPYRSMIDFIFCSPAMAKRYAPGSYQVYPGTVESSGSDHNPIRARFSLR